MLISIGNLYCFLNLILNVMIIYINAILIFSFNQYFWLVRNSYQATIWTNF